MTNSNKIVIVSIIANVLLGAALALFIAFGRTKPIPMYEAEIATLQTKNEQLESENESLSKEKDELDDDIAVFDENLTKVSDELAKSKSEIARLKRKRNEIPDSVDKLPDDSIAVELTKYLQRRKDKR